MATAAKLPSRLHPHRVRLEESRGDPQVLRGRHRPAAARDLVRVGHAVRRRAHLLPLFFGLGDGGALAFFQFAEQGGPGAVRAEDAVHAVPPHRAESRRGRAGRHRAAAASEAGYTEPQTFVLEHGYCRSLYAIDPDGMIVEFTVDHPDVEKINATRRADAHAELKRWLGGDHHSNNMLSLRAA